MKCPYCGMEMQAGYIPNGSQPVQWIPDGEKPSLFSFSIAGQLSWVNLIYEILNEAIILPLYFFMGKVVSDKTEYTNRIKTGLIISFCGYSYCMFNLVYYYSGVEVFHGKRFTICRCRQVVQSCYGTSRVLCFICFTECI